MLTFFKLPSERSDDKCEIIKPTPKIHILTQIKGIIYGI